MEQIITFLITKYNVFIYGFITGAVFQYFEIQAGNVKFNIVKFIGSCLVFGFLTEFAHLVILWDFVNTTLENESRLTVLSIMIASSLYLFIPFILMKENRGHFIEWALWIFWYKKEDTKDIFK